MNRQSFFGPIILGFLFTVAFFRLTFFLIYSFGWSKPGIVINGIHIHHFLFGILLLFLVTILAIHQKFSQKSLYFILGISIGLIVDELPYLITLDDSKNPSLISPVIIVLILFSGWFFERRYRLKKANQFLSQPLKKPTISVVIPTYNEQNFIAASLENEHYNPGNN